jgi:hypothetical protein
MPEFHDRRDGSITRLPEDADARAAREAAFNEAKAAWEKKQSKDFDKATRDFRKSADRPEEIRPVSEQMRKK